MIEVMLMVGLLGSSLTLVMISNTIKANENDGNNDDKGESFRTPIDDSANKLFNNRQYDPTRSIPNPFLFGIKIILLAVAFFFIIFSINVQRLVVEYEGNFSQVALKTNVTQMLGQGHTSIVFTMTAVVGLMFILLVIYVLVLAGKLGNYAGKKFGDSRR